MDYKEAAQKSLRIAERSGSEASLQIGLEEILKNLLAQHGINYNPSVNESLSKLGLSSQMSSNRPDSLFGHVVLDYKEPHLLSNPQELDKAKGQVERYLNDVTDGGPRFDPGESAKWAGVLWDGFNLIFCHAAGLEWSWTKLHETSEASLLSLVQIYRSLGRLPLTSTLLTRYFGKNSDVAKAVLPVMVKHLSERKIERTNLLFTEWKRLFQQVSTYGLSQLPSLREWSKKNAITTIDASQILFAMHTYYSLVVKFLTAELLSSSQTSREVSIVDIIANTSDDETLYKELKKLENGELFRRYRIDNFLEGDFFSWYTNEASSELAQSIRKIAHTFQEFEPATAKLKPEVVKDLLKELYSGLVDEQIRHDLGEYYTPDWLAEYLLDQIEYNGEPNKISVDPACGSGTFIVECIKRVRERCAKEDYSPLKTLDIILYTVRGLDLNPLAVISARANYILAIADLVFSLGQNIEIPIYLADSINVPVVKSNGLLEYTIDTEVGDIKFTIPVSLVQKQVLGKVLLKCEDFINRDRTADQFWNSLTRDQDIKPLLDEKTEKSLTDFYNKIQSLNKRNPPWDSIWCRIVKNNFSPRGFESIDYIIGNPPWVRWSRLPETYRNRVKRFCDFYGLVSGRSYSGGIESDISTVLTFSAVDHWLKDGGRIGFLITFTVFKSASATGFRRGAIPDSSGIRIDQIEDLTNIQPFPDATNETGIYIATKVKTTEEAEFSDIPCRIWYPKNSVRIPPHLTLTEVKKLINFVDGEACPVGRFGSPLFTGKKTDFDEVAHLRGKSDNYLLQSHRGTVTDLARVYWVKVEGYSVETNQALIRTLNTKEFPIAKEVDPFEGWIEADVLFPLLRGRDVGRYCSKADNWYQIIPNRHYAKFENENDFEEKYPNTYSYLQNYEHLLLKRSTYNRYQKELPFYSIYCIGDYSFNSYKVVWLEQQNPKSFRAAVTTDKQTSTLPNNVIIPDHKLYFAIADSLEEAHYLCAFLNSDPVRTWLGGFLIGKQIGTTIFEFMRVPKYDPLDMDHQELSNISRIVHDIRFGTRNTRFLSNEQEHEIQLLVQKITGKK